MKISCFYEIPYYILQLLKDERLRFNFADKDNDGLLSLEEFTLFLRPENYEDMANYELQKSFSSFDQNGDGIITKDEFTNFCEFFIGSHTFQADQNLISTCIFILKVRL